MRRSVEAADSMKIGTCDDPACRRVHFQLYDRNDQMFATAVVPVVAAQEMLEKMKDAIYAIVAGKGTA